MTEQGGWWSCWILSLPRARIVADLEGSGAVRRVHVAEALVYRRVSPGAALGAAASA